MFTFRNVSLLAAFLGLLGAQRPAQCTTTLSLLSYNIHVGIPMGHNSEDYTVGERDLRNLAEVITSAGVDLVALQEVQCEFAPLDPERRHTSAMNEPRLLAGFCGGMHYSFGSTLDDAKGFPENPGYVEWGTPDKWTNNGASHGEYGNCLLSRFAPAAAPENFPLPKTKPDEERRAYLRTQIDPGATGGVPVIVYATHLQHDSAQSRAKQIPEILKRAAQDAKSATVFLLGDMNSTAADPKEKVLEQAQKFGFHDLCGEYAAACKQSAACTFPADKPDVRIDYIFCSKPLHVSEARVIDTQASDHRPVLVRVELEK